RIYRQLGCDIIGMTALPEAKLAREAELHYATIACVTDYDVWHESTETVTVEMVVANLKRNVANAQRIIRTVAARVPAAGVAPSGGGAGARPTPIMPPPPLTPAPPRKKYGLFLPKYRAP